MDDNSWLTSNIDPFLGKCIHGREGAVWVAGSLTNPDCPHCTPPLLKPAVEWMKDDTVLIYDPDGWYRSSADEGNKPRWEEPITFKEYEMRRDMSTIGPKHRRSHV
jgi:hypothetical protein